MAAPAAATAPKKPALVLLELEYVDGGSSPWFNSKGRSFVASLTHGPVTADLFRALAEDGSMSTLASYLDSASPSVSNIGTICYALVGLILFLLFLMLPLALFGLRRFAASMSFLTWVLFELLLITFASLQLMCLLVMLSTWYGMNSALVENIPMAHEWTFEVLQNYTVLTVQMLQAAKGDKKELDNSLSMTTSGIQWLRGNISRWEHKFSAYAGLKSLLTGVVTMLHMGLLGFALVAVIASVLLACGAWRRRTARLAQGRKSPVIVALAAIAATVLLCAHMVVALPMIARWLPICVLADTYLCAPYRDASYSILDNSVRMVWPLSSRPDPFCRLVPSTLFKKCTAKGKTSINNLDACQTKKDKGKLMILKPDDAVIEFQVPQPPEKPPAVKPAAGSADKNVIGDCFYPFRIIHTDMTSVCPLFTDDMLAHWMATVLSVLTGFGTTISAATVAVIFMALGEPNKKSLRISPPQKRVRRIRKRKHKQKKKKKPTSPSPVPSRSHASVQTEGTPPGPTQLNIVLEEPFPVPIKRKRRSQPVMFMPAPPSPLPIPVPVPVPVPLMPRSSPHTRADSQHAQPSVSAMAPAITPARSSDASPLCVVDCCSATGYYHCACSRRYGTCQGSTFHSGYSPSPLPQPCYPCVTTPSSQHSTPAYMVRHTPLCYRMRGVPPTAVEVRPAKQLLGGTVQQPGCQPCGLSAHDKPQKL